MALICQSKPTAFFSASSYKGIRCVVTSLSSFSSSTELHDVKMLIRQSIMEYPRRKAQSSELHTWPVPCCFALVHCVQSSATTHPSWVLHDARVSCSCLAQTASFMLNSHGVAGGLGSTPGDAIVCLAPLAFVCSETPQATPRNNQG